MSAPEFIIGIDLGTTNCVVAYLSLKHTEKLPELFEIEQLIGPGKVAARTQLPSFRYHPAAGEISPDELVLPWKPHPLNGEPEQLIIGEWARELGTKVANRVVSSAKSWLSHPQVDRSAAILPWTATDEIERVSPVKASASYLNYIRQAWNHHHPDQPLERQEVIITVPASFDESARALTVEAAKLAGIPKILLLEEPQAVCYDWLNRHHTSLTEKLQAIRLLLVCDIGGGTTDLSLIQINARQTPPELNRIGVGDHLMLGGDNLDLALAHQAEKQLNQSSKLTAIELSQLVQQARRAKERLLAEQAPEQAKVTLLGSGSKLIGASRSAELLRETTEQLALNGFIPASDLQQLPQQRKNAVLEFGLPYASDPAISKHIAAFLLRHQQACHQALADPTAEYAIPDGVLFNGGFFNSPKLKQQTLKVLANWRGKPLQELDNPAPDLAVAFGAVSYGLARRGIQTKIGGGSARSYFLKLDDEQQAQAVCLLPKGSAENQPITLDKQHYTLLLGQPVQFHLLSSTDDQQYQPGQIIPLNDTTQQFIALPPSIVALDSSLAQADVQLVTTLTEVGTIQLQCQNLNNPHQCWQVEFEIRNSLENQCSYRISQLPESFADASHLIARIYGSSKQETDSKTVKQLRIELESYLGNRDDWDTSLARAVCDELIHGAKKRRRSAQHERNWLNQTGFCIRPGSGYPLDEWRIQQLWSLYPQGLQFQQEQPHWAAWWALWRRCAAGLDQYQQHLLYLDIVDYINPVAAKRQKTSSARFKSSEEMIRLAAVLENLTPEHKIQLCQWLFQRMKKASEPASSWWAFGRIATRVPFYGSAHNVIPAQYVLEWLPTLLKGDWKKHPHQALAVVMMSRLSGDRTRDLPEPQRNKIIKKLQASKQPQNWITMLQQTVSLDQQDAQQIFGDALPSGLRLIG